MGNQAASKGEPWQGFLGPNYGYVLEQYELYEQKPEEVDPELKELFDVWGAPPSTEELSDNRVLLKDDNRGSVAPMNTAKIAAAIKFAENIRTYGHLYASINPLEEQKKDMVLLHLEDYNLTEEDLKGIPVNILCEDAPSHVKNGLDAINYLTELYTKTISFEFHHVHNLEENKWLTQMVEKGEISHPLSSEKRINVLKRLTEVEDFEQFLHRTFVGQKRFSIEGVDMLVPLLDEIISCSVQDGPKTVNIGMAHRGRLNVLAHVLGKPYEMIFSEFQHSPNKDLVPSEGSTGINYGWTGDVKYHLGADTQIKDESTVRARLTLANNPSHLEFVNPVVEGFTRAAQDDREAIGYPTQDVTKSFAILIHGDAAFPGEGIVQETLNLNQLTGYQTGGTIHIIANNMIGFTTESVDSRSTKYASDLAKGFEIPIVHVNADDPDACLAAAYFAYEYRKRFNKDFLIDLIGYRRFGHNEMDEPMVTQPKTYEIIAKRPTVRALYAKTLQEQQVLSNEEVDSIQEQIQQKLKTAYDKVPPKADKKHHLMELPEAVINGLPNLDTSVSEDVLYDLNSEIVTWPENFNVFPKLARILERRAKALEDNGKVDWSLGEALAFATILRDGTPIRITGQDSERGTFAHRHIVLHDHVTGDVYSPLHTLSDVSASFDIHNSPLSEGSVIGFEYGYNVFAPETLVIWEAQFGDFANAGQVIFDQFISAGRAKWGQKSGMVLLLPHGHEGQGPEHSSARLERFLQLGAENNWTVANVTSAAQYFHLLRRQAAILKREEVRPLVVMTPKSLLRNPFSVSDITELTEGSFKRVIEQPELGQNADSVERIVLCTGKVSSELTEKLQKQESNMDWLHVLRVEEIYPFPRRIIAEIFARYKNLKEIVWMQEEPENMGAWSYIDPKLRSVAPEGVAVKYVGRRRRSSPAEGDPTSHKQEQERILLDAITNEHIANDAVTR
ncbi:2-oxoglutarate dehydrogenase E1 component [Metabacillus iocasae]|uniref:2-oxoglutarate dehydrogenase E1 component n=1 Tax=Priestia iocasae TaxID=2291674 RepID=A0ABS2QVV5_9BACI|nr:2-oxoglutarate dehydrogenase E1 component [Metabacillus iocasae]MBM7703618.1 2-oxoglutarate dehydrogenase E1 component [Metabacillus iocasae]